MPVLFGKPARLLRVGVQALAVEAHLHSGKLCIIMFLLVLALLFAAPSSGQTAESYRQRAIELSRKKSWDEAIANYHKALALVPNDALAHYNLALALKYKGDARQAAEEFEASLRLKPKWADAHYGLGATSYHQHAQAGALK